MLQGKATSILSIWGSSEEARRSLLELAFRQSLYAIQTKEQTIHMLDLCVALQASRKLPSRPYCHAFLSQHT